jgi:hypothetical protein
MKKIFYFILLTAELFVSLMLMISLWDVLFYIPIAVSLIVAGLLIWQLVRYFKTNDPATKRKALRNIAFIMLIPIAAFVVTYVVTAIAFIIAFV